MKVLILGSGGREHVFAWKISQSPLLTELFVAPGNAGTASVATNIDISINDFKALGDFCLQNDISMILPGSEEPLVNGLVDFFKSKPDLAGIYVFGPNAKAAQLEGSKDFAKEFMISNSIPTAKYATFNGTQLDEAKNFLQTMHPPFVLKADGLAAGKGVLICETLSEAETELSLMLEGGKFGSAGHKVVIEEFLDGIEFSVFVMTDGENAFLLPEAKDYKRIGEGDTGLNTGGMGSVSPVPFVDQVLMEKVQQRIIQPTLSGIESANLDYVGFIFIGLMVVKGEPFVIEYNVRMGDPETEVVIPRLNNDLLELLVLAKNKRLNTVERKVNPSTCSTVFLVSQGYPESYPKGLVMHMRHTEGVLYFHAGTKLYEGEIVTNGGRVIACSAFGNSVQEALNNSYLGAENITYKGKYFRKDIGQDLLKQNGNS
jgi:phosphoribosylamine--glycine ligase